MPGRNREAGKGEEGKGRQTGPGCKNGKFRQPDPEGHAGLRILFKGIKTQEAAGVQHCRRSKKKAINGNNTQAAHN